MLQSILLSLSLAMTFVLSPTMLAADKTRVILVHVPSGGANRLWVTAGAPENGTESCDPGGSTCYIVIRESKLTPVDVKSVAQGLILTLVISEVEFTNPITGEIRARSAGGLLLGPSDGRLRIVDFPDQPEYEGATIDVPSTVTNANGEFSVFIPRLK